MLAHCVTPIKNKLISFFFKLVIGFQISLSKLIIFIGISYETIILLILIEGFIFKAIYLVILLNFIA